MAPRIASSSALSTVAKQTLIACLQTFSTDALRIPTANSIAGQHFLCDRVEFRLRNQGHIFKAFGRRHQDTRHNHQKQREPELHSSYTPESKPSQTHSCMAIEEGAAHISTAIQTALATRTGALIGRNGTIELETLFYRLYDAKPNQTYPETLSQRLELHAGVWPRTKDSLDKWTFDLLEAIRSCDVLVAGWYAPLKQREEELLNTLNKGAPRIPLRSLEPYYVPPDQRWTQHLAGQRVAVVSSFAQTIESQIENRELIWPVATESLLPSAVEWIPIRTGYAPVLAQGVAEWPSDIQNWSDAVRSVVTSVVESKSSVALIGCGGLGMLIGLELKRRGIVAIVLGGALQVLFGIKGTRWATHSVISQFWNEDWVWPSKDETPNGSSHIENGCYWGKN